MTDVGRRVLSGFVTLVALWAVVATSSPYDPVKSERLTGVIDIAAGATERIVFELDVSESLDGEEDPILDFRFERIDIGQSTVSARLIETEDEAVAPGNLSCSCRGRITIELEADESSTSGFDTISWSADARVEVRDEKPEGAAVDLALVDQTGNGIRTLASGSEPGPVAALLLTVESGSDFEGPLWLQSDNPANGEATLRLDDGTSIRLPSAAGIRLDGTAPCRQQVCVSRQLLSSAPSRPDSTFDWRVVTMSGDPVRVRSERLEVARTAQTVRADRTVVIEPGQEQRWLVTVEATRVDDRRMDPYVMAVVEGDGFDPFDLTLASADDPLSTFRIGGAPLVVHAPLEGGTAGHTFVIRARVDQYAEESAVAQPSVTVTVFWLEGDDSASAIPEVSIEVLEE